MGWFKEEKKRAKENKSQTLSKKLFDFDVDWRMKKLLFRESFTGNGVESNADQNQNQHPMIKRYVVELDSKVGRRRRGISKVGKAIRDRFGEESEVEE